MSGSEAFSRVKIDAQLKDVGWNLTDGRAIRFEHPLTDGTRADYVLCDEHGRPMAVLEAKRASNNLGAAETQAIAYARALGLDLAFLANGEEVRFRDLSTDAHFRPVATIFAQADLTKRVATKTLPLPPLDLQRRFADRLADLRGIVTQQERAFATARTLERALLARLLE